MTSKDGEPIIYEHRVRAILAAAAAAREYSDPAQAARAHTAVLMAAKRNEQDCRWSPK
jgi:hypothetical protein